MGCTPWLIYSVNISAFQMSLYEDVCEMRNLERARTGCETRKSMHAVRKAEQNRAQGCIYGCHVPQSGDSIDSKSVNR